MMTSSYWLLNGGICITTFDFFKILWTVSNTACWDYNYSNLSLLGHTISIYVFDLFLHKVLYSLNETAKRPTILFFCYIFRSTYNVTTRTYQMNIELISNVCFSKKDPTPTTYKSVLFEKMDHLFSYLLVYKTYYIKKAHYQWCYCSWWPGPSNLVLL